MSDLLSAIQRFGDAVRIEVGMAPITMELPASMYRVLEREAERLCRYPDSSRGVQQLTVQTACGAITFTKKTCKECGHDL